MKLSTDLELGCVPSKYMGMCGVDRGVYIVGPSGKVKTAKPLLDSGADSLKLEYLPDSITGT